MRDQTIEARLRALADAVEEYAEYCGGVHDDLCPQDDTCCCSAKWINDGVTGAVNYLREAADARPVVPPRLVWGTNVEHPETGPEWLTPEECGAVPEPAVVPSLTAEEDLGLSIDMLDVDRLREWARLLLVHGPDIGHWGSVQHVAGKMQIMATCIEKAVRDIGKLRALAGAEPSPSTKEQ